MAFVTDAEWTKFLDAYPNAHILQTAQWGQFKQHFGWYPKYLVNGDTGAMVLFRRLPLGWTIAYIPKGPVGLDWAGLMPEIDALCKQEKAFLIYIEPDQGMGDGKRKILSESGFTQSEISIQPRQTILVSLQGEHEDWLERMKQKTRYNIRLAKKKGIKISKSSDLEIFTGLMQVTGERDEFGIHSPDYYREAYRLFSKNDACVILLATYLDEPLAAIMVFKRGDRAWYFYGASNNHERNRMPTYLLQWEAMKWVASKGASMYDLWGIPDFPEDALENQFTTRSDGLWGVYRFKRGFGGEIYRSEGVYQKVLNKTANALYEIILKYRKSLVS